MARDFLDTNILVYAYDQSHPAKQGIALDFVLAAISGEGVTSSHVLAEFSAVMLYKMKLAPNGLISILETLRPIELVASDHSLVRRAAEVHAAYGIYIYDAIVIAAAERARCSRVITEDLNHGQTYFGVQVINPFGEPAGT